MTKPHHIKAGQCAGIRTTGRVPAPLVCATILVLWVVAGADPARGAGPQLLTGPAGTTALSGRIVDAEGAPLTGVRVVDNAAATRTDAEGRFLLAPSPAGKSVIRIDARRVGAAHTDYGFYEVSVLAAAGKTAALDAPVSLTIIDHTHDVAIGSPTPSDVVVRTAAIPGLELVIPRGTVIRDADGNVVTHVGITAVSPAHTPYPMPSGVNIPFAYTIQPSGACLYSANGGVGYARINYPNVFHLLPRARTTFWTYEPDGDGWRIYGRGQVSSDGRQIIPDLNTVITDFYSAECDATTRSHPLTFPHPAFGFGAVQ